MVNLETAVTDGTCPEPQNKPYIFDAPASAVTALKSAKVSLATEANDHGMDCGPQGLSQNLTIASQTGYPIIGIGNTAAQAFAPYRITIDGQRIAIIAATQVIADNLIGTWTATATQPGVASAIDPTQLVREVQQVRRTADTVIVYVHWGTETQACPDPQQEPLAEQLVQAGADVVIGSNAHVLLGGGYLGGAYVDYGLGNFAFYDDTAPETDSGALVITAEGRHITGAVWRPATIVERPAPAVDGHGGHGGHPELERRPRVHQPLGDPHDQSHDDAGRDRALRGASGHHHDDDDRRHPDRRRHDHHDRSGLRWIERDRGGDGRRRCDHHLHHGDDGAGVDHDLAHGQRRRLSGTRPHDRVRSACGAGSAARQGRSIFDQVCGFSPKVSSPGMRRNRNLISSRSFGSVTVSSASLSTMSAWRRSTTRWSRDVVSSMIEPSESMSRMRTAGMPRAAWRILSKERLTMRAYEGSDSMSRTLPVPSRYTPSSSTRPETRPMPAESQSIQVRAVKVSLTAAESARMAISTNWSMAKTGSCTSVRCGPVTWALDRASATSCAAPRGHTMARARPSAR